MQLYVFLIFAVLTRQTFSNELASLPFQIQESIMNVFDDVYKKPVDDTTSSTNPLSISPNNIQTTIEPLTLVDADGDNCVCVPYYFCDNKPPTKKKGFSIDIRFSPARGCTDHQEICCKDKDIRKASVIESKGPNLSSVCGIRNSNGIDFKIIGNTHNEAEFGEFPWTTAIIDAANDECVCGGSLIHPQIILTAAHCVHRLKGGIKIRAGEWDTQTTKERLPYQERLVSDIIVHPNFDEDAVYNDVALLKLIEPVMLDEHIQTVCLPESNFIASDKKNCYATGWGKDKFGQIGNYQVIMKRVELPIVEHNLCQKSFQSTRLGPRFVLHPSFVCAGGEAGKDTCEGDGGAPLVCGIPKLDNRYHQVGIVSWGIGCGDAIPAAYANVALLRNWIDNEVIKMGFDTSFYTA